MSNSPLFIKIGADYININSIVCLIFHYTPESGTTYYDLHLQGTGLDTIHLTSDDGEKVKTFLNRYTVFLDDETYEKV